jgi:hypothetical protein
MSLDPVRILLSEHLGHTCPVLFQVKGGRNEKERRRICRFLNSFIDRKYTVRFRRAAGPRSIVPTNLRVADPKRILKLACVWANYIEGRINPKISGTDLVVVNHSREREICEFSKSPEGLSLNLVDVYKEAKRRAIAYANLGTVTQEETDAAVELLARIWTRGKSLKRAYMSDSAKMRQLRDVHIRDSFSLRW